MPSAGKIKTSASKIKLPVSTEVKASNKKTTGTVREGSPAVRPSTGRKRKFDDEDDTVRPGKRLPKRIFKSRSNKKAL
ncbi:hypothetical protein FOPE_01069 [Fonsecaea pedrosoi]|nr:hypothetical protein FOPE_01069 [Fonsecaea pedrosoi]